MARRAGVSQSTVSLVLSGKSAGRISARTEAAVRQAADELGYRPNVAARALRTGTARTVGLVVTDVTHPFFGPVLRGAQVAAWRAGYAVALVDVANDPDRELASFEALRAGPVDGFLFFTVDPPESTGEHVVALEVSPPGMSFVRFDTERGTELALRHLLELGHTRIGHLGSELDAETFRLPARDAAARARRGGAGAGPVRAGAVPVRRGGGPGARAARRPGAPDGDLLRRRPAGRRRLPRRPRARPADPRATSRSSASTTSRSRASSSRR